MAEIQPKSWVEKLRGLPDGRKKAVLFGVTGVCAAALAAVGVFLTVRDVQKIGNSLQQVNLPQFSLPSPVIQLPDLNAVGTVSDTTAAGVQPDAVPDTSSQDASPPADGPQ